MSRKRGPDTQGASLQGHVWSADQGARWHRRWTYLAMLFGLVGFVLPYADASGSNGTTLSWNFWSMPRPPAMTALLLGPVLALIALAVVQSKAALVRGTVLAVVTGLFLLALWAAVSMRDEKQLGYFMVVGLFLLQSWSAASAHSAHRFGAMRRFRIPLVLGGIACTLVFASAWSDSSSNGRAGGMTSLFSGGAWFLAAGIGYGVMQIIAGIKPSGATLSVVRWMGRLAVFAIPLWLLVIAIGYNHVFRGTHVGYLVVIFLKPALYILHAVLVVGLALANLGDHFARRGSVERFADEVFD